MALAAWIACIASTLWASELIRGVIVGARVAELLRHLGNGFKSESGVSTEPESLRIQQLSRRFGGEIHPKYPCFEHIMPIRSLETQARWPQAVAGWTR